MSYESEYNVRMMPVSSRMAAARAAFQRAQDEISATYQEREKIVEELGKKYGTYKVGDFVLSQGRIFKVEGYRAAGNSESKALEPAYLLREVVDINEYYALLGQHEIVRRQEELKPFSRDLWIQEQQRHVEEKTRLTT